MSIYFEWTKMMSVGEENIDIQHQRLLSQVNKIIDAMAYGITSKKVFDALAFFEQYINEHLAYEEKYMREKKYTDLSGHLLQHQTFRDEYAIFNKKLKSGQTPVNTLIEMEEFLGNWWIKHIGLSDKKYAQEFSRI